MYFLKDHSIKMPFFYLFFFFTHLNCVKNFLCQRKINMHQHFNICIIFHFKKYHNLFKRFLFYFLWNECLWRFLFVKYLIIFLEWILWIMRFKGNAYFDKIIFPFKPAASNQSSRNWTLSSKGKHTTLYP